VHFTFSPGETKTPYKCASHFPPGKQKLDISALHLFPLGNKNVILVHFTFSPGKQKRDISALHLFLWETKT
jgi:hypothetical protein